MKRIMLAVAGALLIGCETPAAPAADGDDPIDAGVMDGEPSARDHAVADAEADGLSLDAEPMDASVEDAARSDAAGLDAAPQLDAHAPDAAPDPGRCTDPVGQWTRFDRCLQMFPAPRPSLPLCWSGALQSTDRRSLLDVRADGTFELTCRHDAERSGTIDDRCDDAARSCGAALAALDPAPVWAECDDPSQAWCQCTVAERSARVIQGTWAIAEDQLRLTHADGALAIDCQASGPPLRGYHAPTCGASRALAAPRSADAPLPTLQVSAVADGFVLAWIDRGVWRTRLDARGEVIEAAHRVDLDAPERARITSLAIVGDALYFVERVAETCHLVQAEPDGTRRITEGIECYHALAGARGPDGVTLVGTAWDGVWRLTITDGPIEPQRLFEVETQHPAAIARTDDAFAIAAHGRIALGDAGLVDDPRPVLFDRLRWDPRRQALFAAQIESPDRIGHLSFGLYPRDGAPIIRQLVADSGGFEKGADVHIEGDGYRIFWGDFDVRSGPAPVANQEILTWRLSDRGEPIGDPQRLTNVPGGRAQRPLAFPTAEGYVLFYSGWNRVRRDGWWSMMHLPWRCLD